MNETNQNTRDENDDFESELRELLPWTPQVIVLQPKTQYPETSRCGRAGSTWKTLSLGLMIGLVSGAMLVAVLQKQDEPRTVEVVRYVEIPAPSPTAAPIPDQTVAEAVSTTGLPMRPSGIDRELDVLIGSYSDRAKLLTRVAESSSSAGTERFEMSKLPDDPHSIFRLRESLKM